MKHNLKIMYFSCTYSGVIFLKGKQRRVGKFFPGFRCKHSSDHISLNIIVNQEEIFRTCLLEVLFASGLLNTSISEIVSSLKTMSKLESMATRQHLNSLYFVLLLHVFFWVLGQGREEIKTEPGPVEKHVLSVTT